MSDGIPTEEESARLTDKTSVVGIDASDYGEDVYQYNGTYKVEYLQQVLEMVGTLGWDEVNLGSITPPGEDAVPSLLLVTPDCGQPWTSDQASVAVAGRVETKYEEANDE